ncbi:MAG: efflux RND transporter periplasmic adaptor subunit [Porticoccaceae bacterium]
MVVAPMAMPVSLKAVGSLSAVREVLLSPETAGRVVAIGFEAGAKVEAGAKLVQLYDAPERADRAAALARANLARTQLERATTLVPTGAESRAMLDQRSAERDQALAEVQQLDARIDQKQIRAPFAGTLGIRLINLGQYLNPGDAIATLSDSSELFVNFSVPQQHLPQLREGGTVRVTTDAFPGRTFTARVNAVESRVSRDTRNIAVQALLSNPDGALRPGMHVAAELELPPEENVLVVPPTAIQATAMGDSVIVVRGPEAKTRGQADHVRVEVGRRSGEKVIVTRGLEVGDVVVTEGQLRVPPGAQVQVTQLQPGEE